MSTVKAHALISRPGGKRLVQFRATKWIDGTTRAEERIYWVEFPPKLRGVILTKNGSDHTCTRFSFTAFFNKQYGDLEPHCAVCPCNGEVIE